MKEYIEILERHKVLQTPRLALRPFSPADLEDVFEMALDEAVTRFLTWETHTRREQSMASIQNYYMARPGIFAIELKENGKCIGCIDLRLEPAHEKASFGYMLNRKYWNRGYMTEALNAILALSFGPLGLRRVEGTHYDGNEGSGEVMRKCGMLYEGMGRQEVKERGVFRDLKHYGILAEDFRDSREGDFAETGGKAK